MASIEKVARKNPNGNNRSEHGSKGDTDRVVTPREVSAEVGDLRKSPLNPGQYSSQELSDDQDESDSDDSERDQRNKRSSQVNQMRGTQGFAHKVRESHVQRRNESVSQFPDQQPARNEPPMSKRFSTQSQEDSFLEINHNETGAFASGPAGNKKANAFDIKGQPKTIKELKEMEVRESSSASTIGNLNYQNLQARGTPKQHPLSKGYKND